jgi:transcriptional repressor NrdR
MRKLEAIDHVAYVRYASVYRQFEDVGEFIDEIKSLDRRRAIADEQEELFP